MSSKTPSTKSAKAEPAAEGQASPLLSKPDLRRLLEGLKLPGIDVQGLLESRGKDVEALLAANRKAMEGYQELARKQAELLAEAMRELQDGAREVLSPAAAPETLSRAATRAQKAFTQALADMRTLAEMAASSHQEVMSIVNQRIADGLRELRASLSKAG